MIQDIVYSLNYMESVSYITRNYESRNQAVEVGVTLLTITLNMSAKFVLPIFMTLGIADLETSTSKQKCIYQEAQQLVH